MVDEIANNYHLAKIFFLILSFCENMLQFIFQDSYLIQSCYTYEYDKPVLITK